MSYQEKRSIVSLASTVLISALYLLIVYLKYVDVELLQLQDFRFWGVVFFILILGMVISGSVQDIADIRFYRRGV
jgi:hypothetical protein